MKIGMNKALASILKTYSTAPHRQYAAKLHGLSKDSVIALFTDLLTIYINDRNSSTIREYITVSMAGYRHNDNKIGFNGFKQTTSGKSIACEAKPKNINSQDLEEYRAGKRKTYHKLRGNGNFTDYTWARFGKDKKENINMLVSGFVDGRLIYLLEFPFTTKLFTQALEAQLKRHFPNGDEPGKYLRSANFDYRHYVDDPDLKVIYCFDDLPSCQKFIVDGFYRRLLKLNDNE